MSNFKVTQEAAATGLQTIAIGEARGATSITAYLLASAAYVRDGVFAPTDAPTLYGERFTWVNAERVALGKDKVTVPEGKSYAAQVSKFRGPLELAELERKGRAGLLDILTSASVFAGSNYKKTLASDVAMRALLAKGDASDDDLLAAALSAQEGDAKPKTAEAAFGKIVKAWDKLADDFPEIVARIKGERPAVIPDMQGTMEKVRRAIRTAEDALADEG